MNCGGLVGEMKSCENCSTYFITKDAKLCKSHFFPFIFFKCTFFFYTLLYILLLFCMFCMSYNLITVLPHVFTQHS